MNITMIACVDIGNGLSDKDGNLLFDLPKDMQFFKNATTGKSVVMGRKTWDSLPIKPLPKRKNYVLTRDISFRKSGVKTLFSIEEVLNLSKSREIMIIGGGEIYNQLLPYASKLLITHVHTVNINAVTFFPEISVDDWKITSMTKHEPDENHKYGFTFATYERAEGRED